MKHDLEQALAKQYPFFVPQDLLDARYLPGQGCMHQDGWYAVLERLLKNLATRNLPADFKIVQVKEKYGALCVHDNGKYGEQGWAVNALYAHAAAESRTICEICGTPGQTRQDDHVRTLCDGCYR